MGSQTENSRRATDAAEMKTPTACWRLWACSEALASQRASASCYCFAKDIGVVAVVVAESKLREVERQILLAHVVIRANDSALQQRPERFDVVRVNLAAHVLMRLVIHCAWGKGLTEFPIARTLVGSNQRDADPRRPYRRIGS